MKLWVIVLTGLVFLLLADVAVLQARLQAMDLVGLSDKLSFVEEEVAKLKDWEVAVAELPTPTPTPTPSATPKVEIKKATTSSGSTREIYILLGSGSTKSQEWVDVGGQVYIDTGAYTIKEAYFEASLKSNSGSVWARLINRNESSYVASSEITSNTSAYTLVRSGKIAVPAGNKLYGIQLKSETQQEVFVENAKVRLIVY